MFLSTRILITAISYCRGRGCIKNMLQTIKIINPLMRYFLFSNLNLVFVFLTKLRVSRRFQPAVYIVVHEESESEVQNAQILLENDKK